MVGLDDFADAQHLSSERLELQPLRPEHAQEMAPLLDDVTLHTFIGGMPATRDELWDRYEAGCRPLTGRRAALA